MKILFCSTLYPPHVAGGAERSVQILCEALTQNGHEVVVVTLAAGHMRRTANVNGVRVHSLPIRNIYMPFGDSSPSTLRKALWHALDTFNPWMAASVGTVLDSESPDLVNTRTLTGFSVSVWRASKQRRLPLVHTLHDYYLLCPRSTMFNHGQVCGRQCFECRLYASPRKRETELVDVVVGVSRFIVDRHLRCGHFHRARNAVVYNPISPATASARDAPAGARQGPLRFGYLGRLHPTKGVDALLRAFLSLEKGVAELWVAGSGTPDYEAALRILAHGRQDVRWLGHVIPSGFLSRVDVLVVPSLWAEAFGRVVVEAFAYGTPVIGSTHGGISELITGDTGWLFNPDELGALDAALRLCLQRRGDLASMGAAAQAHARRFSPDVVAVQYLREYEAALATCR